jgi:hypothetical protein
MLYSYRQQRPAPLPNRIRLSSGFTRYAHQPPTAEEIARRRLRRLYRTRLRRRH